MIPENPRPHILRAKSHVSPPTAPDMYPDCRAHGLPSARVLLPVTAEQSPRQEHGAACTHGVTARSRLRSQPYQHAQRCRDLSPSSYESSEAAFRRRRVRARPCRRTVGLTRRPLHLRPPLHLPTRHFRRRPDPSGRRRPPPGQPGS